MVVQLSLHQCGQLADLLDLLIQIQEARVDCYVRLAVFSLHAKVQYPGQCGKASVHAAFVA